MPYTATASQAPGPLARTCAELDHIHRRAAFCRDREMRSRRRLRESDLLLDLVEQCRLRDYRLVPGQLWMAVVRFLGSAEPALRDELGIDRRPDHVSEILFQAQEQLLRRSIREREPRLAPIVPLFPAPSSQVLADTCLAGAEPGAG